MIDTVTKYPCKCGHHHAVTEWGGIARCDECGCITPEKTPFKSAPPPERTITEDALRAAFWDIASSDVSICSRKAVWETINQLFPPVGNPDTKKEE